MSIIAKRGRDSGLSPLRIPLQIGSSQPGELLNRQKGIRRQHKNKESKKQICNQYLEYCNMLQYTKNEWFSFIPEEQYTLTDS